jgi:hypothetical protein
MEFPKDENGEVLQQMHQAGVDLTQSREVVFIQLFEQKSDAEQMQQFIKQQYPEIQCAILPDETPNVWDLECSVNILPSYENICEQEAFFTQLARQFNGYNDGWAIEA